MDEPRFGLAVPVAPAFGLSAGMVWAALDRYHGGRPVPSQETAPEAGDPLHAELLQRQAAALARAGWTELRAWQGMPEHGWPWAPGIADRTRAEWHRLRRRLDAGGPVMLYLVMARGRHADPSRNQAVLAYGYEIDRRSGRVSLRVYDPTRPRNDGVRLVFRLGSRMRPLDARLAVKTPVRGFFLVPYDRPTPARLVPSETGAVDTRQAARILDTRGTARPEGPLTVIARTAEGRLLQIRRGRRARWSVAPVEPAGKGAGAPVEDATVLSPDHLILRTSAGELVEARRRPPLGWRSRSISGRAVKTAFDARPAVLRDARGTIDVFGCQGGRLLHFRRGKLGGWKTKHVKCGPLARAACTGAPAAVCMNHGTLHVVVRTRTGELIHARWGGKQGWSAENVTVRTGDRARFLIVDDPVMLADRSGSRLTVAGRSAAGSVLLFRWTQRSGWRAQDVTGAPAAEPSLRADSAVSAALDGEGTVHVCARTAEKGLLHAWCTRDGATGAADVTHSRRTVGGGGLIDGRPHVVATPDDGLLVLARQDRQLLLFRWDAAADWSLENVSAEHGRPTLPADPIIVVAQATLHATGLDDAGRLHHLALATPAASGATRVLLNALADASAVPLSAALLVADAALLPVRGAALAVERLRGGPATDEPADDHPIAQRPAAREHPAASGGEELPWLELEGSESTPLDLPPVERDDAGVETADAATLVNAPPEGPAAEQPQSRDVVEQEAVALPRARDIVEEAAVELPMPEPPAAGDPVVELPLVDFEPGWNTVDEPHRPADEAAPLLDVAAGPGPAAEADAEPVEPLPLLDEAPEAQATADAAPVEACELPTDRAAADQAVIPPADADSADSGNADPPELPLLEPAPDEESWLEPWAAGPDSVPPVPGLSAEPWSESPPAEDPWAPADAEPPAEPWSTPAEPQEPWLLTPLESDPWMATPAGAAPDEDVPQPSPDALAGEAGGLEPADEPTIVEPTPDLDDWSMPAPRAPDVDDWSIPPAAAEEASTKAAPEPMSQPSDPDDWNFPPVESNGAPPAQSTERSRKWVNPALEGLPLLDDAEPRVPAAPGPTLPAPPPLQAPPAALEKNGNGKKKKTKKTAAQDELQRVMALADQNRPELLPPS